MASIEKVKGSNSSGNANVATVQSSRSIGATSIIVDTVLDINPAGFTGTMGTPHTFTDPVTSEVITVISEATAVDFAGHVNSGHLEIDTIAPGYTDAGSKVGDIVVVRPTTQWADNLASVLVAAHNDDGSLVGTAVRTALGETVASGAGYTLLANAPNTVTANGNRLYTCVFNAVDLTGTLSPNMILRTTRTVAAPTQSTSLNGTTQFYSRASASLGSTMTFTNNFVVSGYIKLTSYNGAYQVITSRFNGTSGWNFAINATGQVVMEGFNASPTNISAVTSYRSIPLNKWTHVVAQLDMSTFTATTTTSYIMINGVDVPASVSRGGTNPTALIQAGNLEIGGRNGGLLPFGGKIAQVAIYSAKVTQANILATISQGLAGTETSLISAYSFNNSINDLNANANNLTANGSAVATNADSPFGGQADGTISSTLDYAEIVSSTFSTNTTLVVRTSSLNTIPTSGGVSAVSYSTVANPYNCPNFSKTLGLATIMSNTTTTSTTATQVLGLTVPVTIPPGGVNVRLTLFVSGINIGAAPKTGFLTIWDGTVGSGTQVGLSQYFIESVAGAGRGLTCIANITPTAGSKTYNAGFTADTAGGTTATLIAAATTPAFLQVEIV